MLLLISIISPLQRQMTWTHVQNKRGIKKRKKEKKSNQYHESKTKVKRCGTTSVRSPEQLPSSSK